MTFRTGTESVLAAILLVFVTPLLAVTALAIWLTMGRPVFFSQIRSGLHQRPYRMWKFRTLTQERGADGQLLPDEDRSTPLGSLLRRTRIDELPELWHIIRGEMAFIGPRPLLPPTIASMGKDGVRRSSMRPGLTGWAQVHGGPLLDLRDKLNLDLQYIDSASFSLDALILWRTIRVILLGDRLTFNPAPSCPQGRRRPAQARQAADEQPLASAESGQRADEEPVEIREAISQRAGWK